MTCVVCSRWVNHVLLGFWGSGVSSVFCFLSLCWNETTTLFVNVPSLEFPKNLKLWAIQEKQSWGRKKSLYLKIFAPKLATMFLRAVNSPIYAIRLHSLDRNSLRSTQASAVFHKQVFRVIGDQSSRLSLLGQQICTRQLRLRVESHVQRSRTKRYRLW
jgi:hypothetical protein